MYDDSSLYQVTTSYFCCGLIVQDGVVSHAAPIMRWAVGKPLSKIKLWVAGKGGMIQEISNRS